MNIKRGSIITIAIIVIIATGGILGFTAYKIYGESAKKKELEVQYIKENEEQRTIVKQVDKIEDNNNPSDNLTEKIENKSSKVKKETERHADFETKVSSYIKRFKKSGDDIYTLMQSLDNINTNNLNKNEKVQLDNLKLAAREWSTLNSPYDHIREIENPANDPILDEELNYAKEALKCNTQNLINTGIMSKEDVDKKLSLIREYIEKAKKYKENEKKKKDEEIAELNEMKKRTTKERTEYYYKRIKDAMNAEIKYINSIEDPHVRSSVQSSVGAAVSKATSLEMKFPEDTEIIEANLKKVLEGN